MKTKYPAPEGLFDEALSDVPESALNDFVEALEELATDPRIEVIRDAHGLNTNTARTHSPPLRAEFTAANNRTNESQNHENY
jgi:hypothetical protein